MKRLLLAAGIFAGLFVAAYFLTRSKKPDSTPEVLEPTPGLPWFEDVTASAGIDFQHFDSATPEHFIEETMNGGIGWFDYDRDGRPDLLCVQSGPVRPAGAPGQPCKLYRNLGGGKFEDVSERVGLTRTGVGNGCVVGDFDNDGFDDLLITFVGGVALYHNELSPVGTRVFRDVTTAAGLNNPHFATSAAWGDFDGDGRLDLYICNYVELNRVNDPVCEDTRKGIKLGCSPTAYPYTSHQLYRNNGNGTFTDVSEKSGIAKARLAPGLGVVLVDLDGDGKLDIYVANDVSPAHLFRNKGDFTFEEVAAFSGAALDGNGTVMAGMGIASGDIYRDGRPALFVTNYQNLPNVLFKNLGELSFRPDSTASGLGPPSLARLGFGTAFFDADLDGHLDAVVANGHVQRPARELYGVPFAQEAQFFVGRGPGKFEDVSNKVGPYFRERFVGRGLAVADFDGDGKPDLAFGNNAGPYKLLRNATPTSNHGLSIELIGDGVKSNRNAIGAKITIEIAGRKQTTWVLGGGSYLSASDRRQFFGLGAATKADRVTVSWPDGRSQEANDVMAGRWRWAQGGEMVGVRE